MALVQKAWFQIYLNNMVVVLVVVLFNSNIVNPFLISPNSDQHQISPCNIDAYSTPEVMRIKNMITQCEFS